MHATGRLLNLYVKDQITQKSYDRGSLDAITKGVAMREISDRLDLIKIKEKTVKKTKLKGNICKSHI